MINRCIICVSQLGIRISKTKASMTITKKYIDLLFKYIGGSDPSVKNFRHGIGWKFPCPFCSGLEKKEYKKKQSCASLIPNGNYSYVFHCCRKKSSECKVNMLFPIFLKTYNPKLFARYHLERERAGTTGKGHDISRYNYFGENNA